jgi:hypothetical protein
MSQATYEDANLVLKLYELRREEKLRQARQWFTGQFSASSMEEWAQRCPPGSPENAYFRMVTSYWDMAALFVVQGVLDSELFVRSAGECIFVWERIRPFIAPMREAYQNPLYLKNLETVAESGVEWMKKNAPGSYEAFVARVAPRK